MTKMPKWWTDLSSEERLVLLSIFLAKQQCEKEEEFPIDVVTSYSGLFLSEFDQVIKTLMSKKLIADDNSNRHFGWYMKLSGEAAICQFPASHPAHV